MPANLVRRGITADNPTGIYISYNVGWINTATGNFGGNLTFAELNPSSPPAVYSIKLYFNDPNTLIQDYWGDYHITHYQSGAYHVQPGTTDVNDNNRTRMYQFNAMYPVTANSSTQSAFLSAASLLHGPLYTDRETSFQRDDIRVAALETGLPTSPVGPWVRSSGMTNSPGTNDAGSTDPSASASSTPTGLYAGIAAGALALILLLIVAVFVARRKKEKKTQNGKKIGKTLPPGKGWSAVDSSPSSITNISKPAPGSGHIGGASGSGEKVALDILHPNSAMTHGGVQQSGLAGAPSYGDEYHHTGLNDMSGPTAYGGDVSHFVMGDSGATPEQQQLDFVEQYASPNYQPNPYRDTMATGVAQNSHNQYRDTLNTMNNGYQGGFGDAPPVPMVPDQHYHDQHYHDQYQDQQQFQYQENDVDIGEMMERYGHDSMYPQDMTQYRYDPNDAPPMPNQQQYKHDTYFPPPSPNAGQYGELGGGSSFGGSSTLKQRLEEEEAKLTAQQRHLAEVEQYDESQTMMHQDSYEMNQQTSGVVRSRGTISKVSKSPAKADAPRDWLGGAVGSFTQDSALSRSPGNYI